MNLASVMRNVRSGLAPLRLTLLISISAIVLYLLTGAASGELVFDRHAIELGEWWRLVTGHLVHGDAQHLLLDVGAFLIVGILAERRAPHAYRWSVLLGWLSVTLWLCWGVPQLSYYCGLSGVLNATMALLFITLWRSERSPLVMLIIVGYLGKQLLELTSGDAMLSQTLWPSLPSAHWAGMGGGGVAGYLAYWREGWGGGGGKITEVRGGLFRRIGIGARLWGIAGRGTEWK